MKEITLKNGGKVRYVNTDIVLLPSLTPIDLLLNFGEVIEDLNGSTNKHKRLAKVIQYHIDNGVLFDMNNDILMSIVDEISAAGFASFDSVKKDKLKGV